MPFDLQALYADPDAVVVTAHRGFSGCYPENTLGAFAAALDLGVDILEFDLRGTRDGVPIVLHDATLARTADRPGAPGDYTLVEIKTFAASYWRGPHDTGVKLSAPADPAARIPTFEELLDAVGTEIGLNIQVYDTSPPLLAEICRLYRAYDLYARGYLTLSTFDEAARVRGLDPDIDVCILAPAGSLKREALERRRAFGCRTVQPRRADVTPEFCAAARALGLGANMFYANTAADARTYVEMGLQGLLTDRPDLILQALDNLGRRRAL